jgi:hypothetical protein
MTPFDAAVVVEMSMGVDHRHDRLVVAGLPPEELHPRPGVVRADRRVDDDQPVRRVDDREVRAETHLIQPIDDLEQATALDQLRLPPQARVHRLRRRVAADDRSIPLVLARKC